MGIATRQLLLGTIFALVSAHANAAWDGPLGLKEGLSLAQIQSATKVEPMQSPLSYSADTLPVPHAAFAWYALTISKNVGLCEILAVSPKEPSDAFGQGLRRRYTAVRDALVEKYGKPSLEKDRVRPGSMWTEPQYFMMGLLKGERDLGASWLPEKNGKLPASLANVRIMAGADSVAEGNFALQYRFSNYQACEAEEKAIRNKGL